MAVPGAFLVGRKHRWLASLWHSLSTRRKSWVESERCGAHEVTNEYETNSVVRIPVNHTQFLSKCLHMQIELEIHRVSLTELRWSQYLGCLEWFRLHNVFSSAIHSLYNRICFTMAMNAFFLLLGCSYDLKLLGWCSEELYCNWPVLAFWGFVSILAQKWLYDRFTELYISIRMFWTHRWNKTIRAIECMCSITKNIISYCQLT